MTALYQSQYRERSQPDLTPLLSEKQLPATFGEGVAASFRYMRDEGLSVSRGRAYEPYLEARDAEIEKLTGEKVTVPNVTDEPWYSDAVELARTGELSVDDQYNLTANSPQAKALASRISPDYLRAIALREALRKRFPDRILSDEEITAKVKDDLAGKRAINQGILSRSSGFSQFVGVAGGAMTDPLVILTLPLGAEWQGGRMLMNAAKAFGSEFLVGAGTEAVIQGEVYRFKQDIESPYTKAEAILNVLAAGVGAGLLRATAGAIIDVGTELRTALKIKGARESLVRAGIDPVLAERIADEAISRSASRPADISIDVHSANVDRAIQDVDAGRLPDASIEAARFAEDQATIRQANEVLDVRAAELTATAGNRLSRGERQALIGEVRNTEYRLEVAKSDARLKELVGARKEAGETGRNAKSGAARDQAAEVEAIRKDLEALQEKVSRDDKFREAASELSRLEALRSSDPLKAAERYGFLNPKPIRDAVRRVVDEARQSHAQGVRAFDPDMEAAKLRAEQFSSDPIPKPKVDKGSVPEALRPPNVKPVRPAETPREIPVAENPAIQPDVESLPNVMVAIGERPDGTLDTKAVKEVIAEIDGELLAIDRIDLCLRESA